MTHAEVHRPRLTPRRGPAASVTPCDIGASARPRAPRPAAGDGDVPDQREGEQAGNATQAAELHGRDDQAAQHGVGRDPHATPSTMPRAAPPTGRRRSGPRRRPTRGAESSGDRRRQDLSPPERDPHQAAQTRRVLQPRREGQRADVFAQRWHEVGAPGGRVRETVPADVRQGSEHHTDDDGPRTTGRCATGAGRAAAAAAHRRAARRRPDRAPRATTRHHAQPDHEVGR